MKRLSIIVPMYNVAPYVAKCMLSLEEQDITKEDYEIICINDGSPDNCKDIILDLQKEFSNILLIDQENQGVSRARNKGIDKATGKYLMFVDPDDHVDVNCFGSILKNADDKAADVLFLGYTILEGNGEIRYRAFEAFKTERVYCGIEAYQLTRGDGRTDPDRAWAILYKREFINSHCLRFLPDVPYLEDGELIVRILCFAEHCIFDGHSFYRRTTRKGSATHSKLYHSEKATNGFLKAASNLKSMQNDKNLNERQMVFLNQPILKFLLFALNSSTELRHLKKLSATIQTIKELKLKKVRLEGCNSEYMFYGKAYNFSPWIGIFALIMYGRVERLFEIIIRKNPFTN